MKLLLTLLILLTNTIVFAHGFYFSAQEKIVIGIVLFLSFIIPLIIIIVVIKFIIKMVRKFRNENKS